MTGHTVASSNDPSSFEDVYDSAGMSMACFGSINNVKTEMLLDTGSVLSKSTMTCTKLSTKEVLVR